MKRFLLFSLALVPSFMQARETWYLNHHWKLSGEWDYVRRAEIKGVRLAENDITGKKVLTSKNLVDKFSYESAITGTLEYTPDECATVELTYTYFFPWKAQKSVRGDENLQYPFKTLETIDYIEASRVEAVYESWVQNAELNYWGHLTPRLVNYFSFSWLFGARFFYVKEDFTLTYSRFPDVSDYDITTKNNLYGLQLGLLMEVNPTCNWTWSIDIRGGGFFNDARNFVDLKDQNNEITLRDYRKDTWTSSWLIEGIGKIVYRWTDFFHLYAGYQGFLLSGLALGPEQVDKQIDTRRFIDKRGQIVLHGLFAGGTFSF